MRRVLAHRLTALEQHACACDLVTRGEVDAAMAWLRTATRAYVDAVLHGQDPPARDATPAHAESAMVDCWCQVRGTYSDPEGAGARLSAALTIRAARYAAALPPCFPARSPR